MSQRQPFFSIIVPTYGRPGQLYACLQSLARLDYPAHDFEVIVVDDGSKTPPESVVASFRAQLNITLLTQPHAGPATVRNIGARHAKGEFLAFTDDDCAPAPDWLQTLAARFATASDCMIGGRILNALPNNPYSTASQLLIDYLYEYYNTDSKQVRFFASNNLATPVDGFHAVGGFDTTFPLAAAEDRDLCDRWLSRGYRMAYAPEVRVYHAHALTIRRFWRQHFNYGRGAFCFHRARSQRGQGRIRLEPLSFYLNLLSYPFSHASARQGSLLTLLLAVSQGANAMGFFWELVNQTTNTDSLEI